MKSQSQTRLGFVATAHGPLFTSKLGLYLNAGRLAYCDTFPPFGTFRGEEQQNMSRYTSHTPMDFEFQNGTGPMDSRSPFANVSANPQRYPPGMSSPSKNSEHVKEKMKHEPELMDLDVEQRSVFDASPSKSRQQSSPTKPLPPTPAFKNGLFNTPRKPSQDFDDSSAGETPKSPESDCHARGKEDESAERGFDQTGGGEPYARGCRET